LEKVWYGSKWKIARSGTRPIAVKVQSRLKPNECHDQSGTDSRLLTGAKESPERGTDRKREGECAPSAQVGSKGADQGS